ncbi:MAG: SDR family oxidoreductase [Bacteroidota bacterium]
MSYNLLKGKKGIIFGAMNDSSIAWHVAKTVHEEGGQFVLSNNALALRLGTLPQLAEETGSKIIEADATSIPDLERVFKESQEILGGKIDFLLHSVAMSPNVRKGLHYTEINYDYMMETLDVSAVSLHKMLHVALKQDAFNEWASVLALSYVGAQRVFSSYSDMSNAKALLESVARQFGYHLGWMKKVRVNTVSQSPTPTTAAKVVKKMDAFKDYSDDMSPLGNASAEDCAKLCAVMFSDMTRMVTMQNIFHDGGFSSMGISNKLIDQYMRECPCEDEKNEEKE